MKLLPLFLTMSVLSAALSAAPASAQVAAYVRGSGGLVGQDRLEDGDLVSASGEIYDVWNFTAAAGDQITISLSSSDFDTFVSVFGTDSNGQAVLIGTNDNMNAGTSNSVYSMSVSSGGEFTVVVSAYDPFLRAGYRGAYTLEIGDYSDSSVAGVQGDAPNISEAQAVRDLNLATQNLSTSTSLSIINNDFGY